ncbi:MAG: ATP-binding cassette domain-containing protein [Desulfovibrio sp.]|uniref:ATP-binding cassette domain-containing protein n=1 Tax=Desulfovibrio sp. TaxID=885 RepID=UPI0025C341C9|nr:ATP-binding cassette domain-containing protein [Desulfovibrio sp.]MCI7569285.1 ATP-binding cassette domain-containing protein [Desulfovibrio sp.]
MTTRPAPDARGEADAVVLRGLRMRFGAREALRGIDARITPGRITGLVGPDAAGKTTLLRLVAGLMRPSGGDVRIFGMEASALLAASPNSIGYMPQRFGLYEDLTVRANLELHARLRGVEGEERAAVFARLLSFTSLAPFTERLAGRLSGGMKQKLGIACALLGAPRLLLLDEPGVGVDPLSRRELWEMVGELSRNGMTIIWSTAYLDEAARCPEILMLDEGRLLYAGPPQAMADRARGRVFLLSPARNERRRVLQEWMQRDGVDDVVVQGGSLRVVLSENAPETTRARLLDNGMPASPRLEDAYMSALGGMLRAPSPFGRLDAGTSRTEQTERIVARGLTKRFGSFTAADDISFNVHAGEIFGLLGPNGAGKSTTFRMLCGLSRPTAGRCAVDGVDLLRAGSAARARLGYMAQKFSLYPELTVRQNIRVVADLYGVPRQRQDERIPELCAALGLQDALRQRTEELPLGQKQRLALLCATLHEPPVLFLDEPTSGVDARTRRDFWKHILALTAAGTAVLVTTHFMEEAEYCDRLALINNGAVIRMGTPDALKEECARTTGRADPTLEEAFIACIEEQRATGEPA